jgi:TPR repeat protein
VRPPNPNQDDMRMGFDNPFPTFPTSSPPQQQSQQIPIENGMANMSINGRPSIESSRPATSASKMSNKSANSYQSDNSHYGTDPTSYESSTRESFDKMGGPNPSFDPRGPMMRSATMPIENRPPPTQDRRPPTRQGPNQELGFGSRPRDPIDARSASAMGSRLAPGSGPGPMRPLARAQTFDTHASQPQSPRDALDDYMPNFDAVPETNKVEDALGLPLDSAPGIPRPATRNENKSPLQQQEFQNMPNLNRSRSQPNFRNQEPAYGQDIPNVPPMPGAMAFNGQRAASPGPMPRDNRMMGPQGPAYGGPGAMGGMQQGPRPGGFPPGPQPIRPGLPHRLDTQQSTWSDPGPGGRGAPMSAPVGGNMRGFQDRAEPGPPSANPDALPYAPTPANPDSLPGHPAPVRPGLMQNGPPQQQRRGPPPASIQSQNSVEAPPPEKPVTWLELNDLRDFMKGHPNDHKTQFKLAKRLVEAADVLADEDGEADAKTKAKNREKFILEAHKNVKKLVQHSYPEAMFYLADCYGTGQLGLAVDMKEAFNLYQAAAKLGHGPSAYRTAICCEVERKDALKAVQWYRRAAALGEVGAMYKLGMILLKGLLGQQQSVGEAVIWLNRAAERADEDHPHALHELAFLHEYPPRSAGDKIIRDVGYALQLYEQGARLGYAKSQARLGKAFEHGEQSGLPVPQDDRASIHWFSKAAAQGDPEAELALSGWYLTGSRGVLEPNDTEAYLWARKSAMKEYPKAEFAMGYFSEVGIGCPTNLEDAKRWYGRSACEFLNSYLCYENCFLICRVAHNYVKAKQKLEDLRKGNTQKTRQRISRSKGSNEECVVM